MIRSHSIRQLKGQLAIEAHNGLILDRSQLPATSNRQPDDDRHAVLSPDDQVALCVAVKLYGRRSRSSGQVPARGFNPFDLLADGIIPAAAVGGRLIRQGGSTGA